MEFVAFEGVPFGSIFFQLISFVALFLLFYFLFVGFKAIKKYNKK